MNKSASPKCAFPRSGWLLAATGSSVVLCVLIQLGYPLFHQHRILAELRAKGIDVMFAGEPEWLPDWFGTNWHAVFSSRLSLNTTEAEITERDLKSLADIDHLFFLILNGSRITDPDLVHLEKLTFLENLSLDDTEITTAGLVHLTKLRNLERLWLDERLLTDQGLEHIAKITSLQILTVTCPKISIERLGEIKKGLPGVEIVVVEK